MHSQTKDLLAIVKRGEAEEIEAARDLVRPELLPELLAAYWTLPTWNDKAGLMQLFSDHFTTGGEKVMLDFLTAPTTELNDEYYTSGKIVALCQLAGTFELFERLWYNRPLCAAVIQRALAGETPSLALVNALDKPKPQPRRQPVAPKPQKKALLAGLPAWQRDVLTVVFLILYGVAGFGLLYFLLANPVRATVSAMLLALGGGGYLLYSALEPKMTQGEAPALRWLLAFCGLFTLGLAAWGVFALFSGDITGGIRMSRERPALALPDSASLFVIGIMVVLPMLLAWGVTLWRKRWERSRWQAAQQEGEVFMLEPLVWGSLLWATFGMLMFSLFAFIAGLAGTFSLPESLFVAGLFAAIGMGLLAFLRQMVGLVVLTADGVAVRRPWARERAMRYAEIESIRPMAFAVPPNMVLRGGRRKLRIPRTTRNFPRLYELLHQRMQAARSTAPSTIRRFALPKRPRWLDVIEGWFMEPQALIALELSPLQIRYQRKGIGWRARSAQDIASIAMETRYPRHISGQIHVHQAFYDVVITFSDGEQLRIQQQHAVQLGTTPEQLRVILQELYGK